jgi:hypothetical protein
MGIESPKDIRQCAARATRAAGAILDQQASAGLRELAGELEMRALEIERNAIEAATRSEIARQNAGEAKAVAAEMAERVKKLKQE